MAQIVKLRRSSVSGQKPTNSNLQLGELALNTTDGKVYMAKSGSLGPSVEELISTNTVNTGSISLSGSLNITGSTTQVGNNTLLGNTELSGSVIISGSLQHTGSLRQSGDNTLIGNTLISGSFVVSGSYPPGSPSASMKVYGNTEIDGYAKFLPVTANLDTTITGSYIFVSGSTDDLYFSQNGNGYSNVTRLRWLEGNLYTGLLNGGIITATAGGTTFNVAAGSGVVVNLNASLTENPFPTIKYVNWDAFTGQTLTYRTTHIQTFIGINDNGEIIQQTGAFNDGQYNTTISLGTVLHQNLSTVNASITYPNMAYGYKQRTYDFIKAFGPLKLSGLEIVPTGTLGLNVGSGTAWADGRNYQIDPNNPSYIIDTGTAVSKIFRYHQISGTTFSQDTNNASGYTTLDVTHYNNNGTLTTVPGNNVNNYEWTIQRIFWYPNSATKGIVAYYGNRTYTSATEAAANVQFEPFVEVENTKQNAVYLGAIAVRKDAVWDDSTTYLVLPGGIFRNVGGSGGGGSVPTGRLTDLTDVDVAGATNGDIVSYSTTSNKWEHGKSLTGDYTITGSLNVTGGLTGSIDYSNLTNTPTLVSGSSQIDITGTTGYSTFSGSISSSIGELSSSIATTTNDLDGRLDSIEGVTGSYATTGSNQFNGNQSISGSVVIGSGSLDITSPETLHVGNSGSYNIARFDGYDNNYAQINVKNYHSGSGASTDIVITADNGTENIHYVDLGINSSNYNAGYVGHENDAYLLNAGKDLYVGTIGGAGHPSNLNLFAQNKWETPQILISGSGQVGFNTLNVTNGYEYEFSGSIKANHSLNVIGDVSASIFTGSFTGDGNGLYNIPASGVTGLELNKIVSGSVSASIQTDGTFRVNGNTYIDGTLTAKELYIDYVTSSVLYQSGSTKFGDTSDDTHQFTGSVKIEGSLNSLSLTGSIDYNNLTNVPTLVSGSSQVSYTGITDVPNGIVSGSSQVSFTGITDVPTLVSGSSQVTYSGLTGIPNGIVSGSSQISYTGITDISNGIVSGSQQVIDLGFTTTSSFESFTSSYTTHSASFDSRINTITGSITIIDGLIDDLQLYTGALNNITSSFITTSQTSSMTVLSSSYALTASYALNGGGGGTEGRTAKLEQTVSNTTWTFSHNLGEQYPAVTIFDSNDNVVIPTSINAQDDNTLIITFSSPQTGTATATVGGGLPYISSSFDGRVLAADTGAPTWKGGMVSGSLQISNFGFATTGSNTFIDDQTISGTLTITNALIQQTTSTGVTSNTVIATLPTGSYDGGFFDYVIKNGTNLRAGTVTSVWNDSNVVFNEVTTNDLGDTTNVNMIITVVNGNANLNANISSGTWTIKVLSRGL